jgi:chemotaxis protein CheZ
MTHPLETELRRLTDDLQTALEDFRNDSRLAQLAEHEVPDARVRLQHVLKLTDDAAHQTLDLVEQSVPLAERTTLAVRAMQQTQHAQLDPAIVAQFLTTTGQDMDRLRSNLSSMLLAQGYQDLSGQILRGVMKLVDELERTLARLLTLTCRGTPTASVAAKKNSTAPSGPAIPGLANGAAVSAQNDVDDLLTGLGL